MSREEIQAKLATTKEDDPYRFILLAKLFLISGEMISAKDYLNECASLFSEDLANDFYMLNEFSETVFRAKAFTALSIFSEVAFGVAIEIEITSGAFGCVGLTQWVLDSDGSMRFVFDEMLYDHPYLNVVLKYWVHGLRMYCYFRKLNPTHFGSVHISLEDMGVVPGISFSDFRSEYSLLPDPEFMGSGGYAAIKWAFDHSGINWSDRSPIAIWRGSTTGWFDTTGARVDNWRNLPRIQLCELANRYGTRSESLDAGITSVNQIAADAGEDVAALGIMRPVMDWREFQYFKFQIDIDGNSSSWPGLFTKLCSGSVVFKVSSPVGFRQWYYDRLIPWINYVPVAADMSDLLDKIEFLKGRDDLARLIGTNGRQLTVEMTPMNETYLSEQIILQAFRAT